MNNAALSTADLERNSSSWGRLEMFLGTALNWLTRTVMGFGADVGTVH